MIENKNNLKLYLQFLMLPLVSYVVFFGCKGYNWRITHSDFHWSYGASCIILWIINLPLFFLYSENEGPFFVNYRQDFYSILFSFISERKHESCLEKWIFFPRKLLWLHYGGIFLFSSCNLELKNNIWKKLYCKYMGRIHLGITMHAICRCTI